jgi:hypothetical protein
MPSLSFFADERDAPMLIDWLNRDAEIAFVVPDGPTDPLESYVARVRDLLGATTEAAILYPCFTLADAGRRQRWKAVTTVHSLRDGKHVLWHVPLGRFPLHAEHAPNGARPDPWKGWTEDCFGDPAVPYFDASHPAEIHLELWTRHRPYSKEERASLPVLFSFWNGKRNLLVVSTFGWKGDPHSPTSRAAATWWRRLEAWIAAHAAPVCDLLDADSGNWDRPWKCWAFPSALERLRNGIVYDARGWDRDSSVPLADSISNRAGR